MPPLLWHTYHSLRFVPAVVLLARFVAAVIDVKLGAVDVSELVVGDRMFVVCCCCCWVVVAGSNTFGGGGDLLCTFMCLRSELGCV